MEGSLQMRTQDKVFGYLQEREAAGLPSPTIEEIRSALSIGSTSTVRNALSRLADEGRIAWIRGQSRSIRVLDGQGGGCRKVPVMTEDGQESGRFLMIDETLLPDSVAVAVPGRMFWDKIPGAIGFIIMKDAVPQEGSVIVTREDGKYRLRRYHSFMLEALYADDPIMLDRCGTWPENCLLAGVVTLSIMRWN